MDIGVSKCFHRSTKTYESAPASCCGLSKGRSADLDLLLCVSAPEWTYVSGETVKRWVIFEQANRAPS